MPHPSVGRAEQRCVLEQRDRPLAAHLPTAPRGQSRPFSPNTVQSRPIRPISANPVQPRPTSTDPFQSRPISPLACRGTVAPPSGLCAPEPGDSGSSYRRSDSSSSCSACGREGTRAVNSGPSRRQQRSGDSRGVETKALAETPGCAWLQKTPRCAWRRWNASADSRVRAYSSASRRARGSVLLAPRASRWGEMGGDVGRSVVHI